MTPKYLRLATVAVALLVFFAIIPLAFSASPYVLNVLTNALILSVIASGVWLTFAIGRINIAQGAFAMIGGYATAILSTRYGVSFWLCLPLSGLVAAAVGVVIGWPVLRLRGVYFSMISLSITEAVRLAFLNGGEFTRGASGIINIPRPDAISIFGITLVPEFDGTSPLPYYYLAVLILTLTLLSLWRIANSRLGWTFRSMRMNEELAASIGVNVAKYRVIAFAICCFIGGVGGSFFAAFQQNIYPATYTVNDSIFAMLYCFLGGLDYIAGPMVGAFLLVISFELLHPLQQYQPLIYALLMIGFMLWLPNGILSLPLFERWMADTAPRPEEGGRAEPAGAVSKVSSTGRSGA
ncbi:MAG TPA: branched-chain amino acid ABC transporter permease [Candidatus Competibacteraceae bacterium]|nr:branched-chain amino acid ABC transporter permease [Candidatus Competibacteraceae bacterium]